MMMHDLFAVLQNVDRNNAKKQIQFAYSLFEDFAVTSAWSLAAAGTVSLQGLFVFWSVRCRNYNMYEVYKTYRMILICISQENSRLWVMNLLDDGIVIPLYQT